jgi:hypothetical protein
MRQPSGRTNRSPPGGMVGAPLKTAHVRGRAVGGEARGSVVIAVYERAGRT